MVQSSVRRRGRRNSHGQDSSYFMGWEEYKKNPYSPINNPHGIIQMGLAENQLSFDLLETWLADNPGAAGFDVNGGSVFRELALFQDYNGLPAFKKALADFMGTIRGDKVRFDPKKLVLTAGATSANEILMFCLAEPGDGFLVPTPYYPGFDRDLKWRTGAEIIPISCSISNSFQITRTALEEAYRRAGRSKIKVKGVLVTNPSNPLGTTITRQELDTIIDFIQAKDIDLISDEIYSGTVFGSPDFISVREAIRNRPPKISTRTHIVCSLSKDLGLPGFRVGAIYSENVHVLTTATKMSSFGLVSSQTQYLLAQMLSDIEFSKKYLEENRLRLERRHGMLVTGLMNAGIKCLRSNAGLFCWVDMRHLLKTSSFDGEMELWKRLLYDVKLNVSPGSSCHCEEPGWFRVCFANMEEETLILAMERMQDFVQSYQVDDDGGGDSRRITKSSGRFLITRWSVLKFLSKNRDFTEYKLPEKEHNFFHKSYTGLKSVVFSG